MNEIHMIGSVICSVIALILFGILIYSTIRSRRAMSNDARHFHKRLWVEIMWITVSLLIMAALAAPAMIDIYQHWRVR